MDIFYNFISALYFRFLLKSFIKYAPLHLNWVKTIDDFISYNYKDIEHNYKSSLFDVEQES